MLGLVLIAIRAKVSTQAVHDLWHNHQRVFWRKTVVPIHRLPRSSWALPSRLVQLSTTQNFSPLSKNLPCVTRTWFKLAAAGAPWTLIGMNSFRGLRCTMMSVGQVESIFHSSS